MAAIHIATPMPRGNTSSPTCGPAPIASGFPTTRGTYADEYWNNRPTVESAHDIVVPTESTVTGKDAELSETPPPLPPVVNATPPTISGLAQVGKVLTANPGTWDPPGVSTTFQWLANGAVVAGATGSTYSPRVADAGKRISVRVTVSKTGFTATSATSAQTATVPKPAVANRTKPTISGKAIVGKKLTVKPGSWTPGSVKLTYRWLANGVAVKKATKSSFVLTAKQVGKRITVKVTASAPGYTSLSVTTARTAKVKPKP